MWSADSLPSWVFSMGVIQGYEANLYKQKEMIHTEYIL